MILKATSLSLIVFLNGSPFLGRIQNHFSSLELQKYFIGIVQVFEKKKVEKIPVPKTIKPSISNQLEHHRLIESQA